MQKKIAASKNGQLKLIKASVSLLGEDEVARSLRIRVCGDNKKGIWSSDYYSLYYLLDEDYSE